MIVLIQGNERAKYANLINQMHMLRARVFNGRLGWEVQVTNDRERDRFDDLDPLYVLSVAPTGRVVGSLRALQTTGPHMLSEVFSQLLPEGESIRSPLIWESTRSCLETEQAARGRANTLSVVTGELLCGLFETARAVGLRYVVSVFDVRTERILARAGCPCERLGPPVRIGGVMTVAGLFEVDDMMIERLYSTNEIPRPVVLPGDIGKVPRAA